MKYKKYLSILSVSIFAVSALMFGSVHSASAGFWDWSGIWGDSQQAQVNSPTYTGGPSLSNTFLSSSSSAQPLVTVLQPNGGEVCKVGSVCRISWAYKNIAMTSNYLAINLLKG
ncbi:hypothetical protein KGQ29_04035, partial [Patescibacteria group bacterium]|nr:hypothetical protein [Patescibacteria group bacterium]